MQYHYVVGYDSEFDRWFVEADSWSYFSDGNVFDSDTDDRTGYGWMVPEEGSREEAIDQKCLNMLNSLVTIWPSPETNGEL